jgi:putative tricarboxylic transport membrane protein
MTAPPGVAAGGGASSGGGRQAEPGRSPLLDEDVRIAIAIVAFCAVVFAATLTFDTIPAALTQGMGPALFPQLLLAVLVALSVILAAMAWGRPQEAREPIPPMVYATGAAMAAFMAAVWLAGMLAAMFVAYIGIGRLWGERRWPLLLASGGVLCAVIYVLFVKGFKIPLPGGIIDAWLA